MVVAKTSHRLCGCCANDGEENDYFIIIFVHILRVIWFWEFMKWGIDIGKVFGSGSEILVKNVVFNKSRESGNLYVYV